MQSCLIYTFFFIYKFLQRKYAIYLSLLFFDSPFLPIRNVEIMFNCWTLKLQKRQHKNVLVTFYFLTDQNSHNMFPYYNFLILFLLQIPYKSLIKTFFFNFFLNLFSHLNNMWINFYWVFPFMKKLSLNLEEFYFSTVFSVTTENTVN